MEIKEIKYGTSGIYKIIFSNQKIYIGLSNDIRRRMIEHLGKDLKEHPELLISKAIEKHGIKDIEILEIIDGADREKLKEREIFWIEYHNAFRDRAQGYNLTPGGDGASTGVDNTASYLSQESVNQIFNLLLNSQLTYNEIAAETNSSYPIVSRINNGQHYRDNCYDYPLRQRRVNRYDLDNKSSAFYDNPQTLLNIILDLKNTTLFIKDIAKKYELSESLIGQINRGQRYSQEGEVYPIREGRGNSSHKRVFSIDELFYIKNELEKAVPMQNIANSLKCDRKVISDINKGARQKNPEWTYPLKINS